MGLARQIDQRLELNGQSGADGPSGANAQSQHCTLLELISAVAEITSNEDELVATVLHLLHSGQVTLRGNFRGAPLDCFAR